MDDLTVIIKTVDRPHACARLSQSLRRHAPGVPIHVLDDGINKINPEIADVYIPESEEVGLSVGRNRLLDTIKTKYFLMLDDDHVVSHSTDLPGLFKKAKDEGWDVLAGESVGSSGGRNFVLDGKTLYVVGCYDKKCDMVPNSFIAKTEAVKRIRWRPELKVQEHWEFFYRAKQHGLLVGYDPDHVFGHVREMNARYKSLRRRNFIEVGLRLHGLDRIIFNRQPGPLERNTKVRLRSLEWHCVHSCNLSCSQCSHYSNLHTGGIVSVEEADENFSTWNKKIVPDRVVIMGGEPTIHPKLEEVIDLAAGRFPQAKIVLVTNGFFLHKHPSLPRTLLKHNVEMSVSQHGTDPEYVKAFMQGKNLIHSWKQAHPNLFVTWRQSHVNWQRQYKLEDGKPLPFDSDERDAWDMCCQKKCTQLYKNHLWKCPAIAYFHLMDEKLKAGDEWSLFRQYQALPPSAATSEIIEFLNRREIPQCKLCPSEYIPHKHNNPLVYNLA